MDISLLYDDFFDVSVVMPFYKKLDIFRYTLQKNHHYFSRNGVEVIIVMDEPTEEEGLLALIDQYPFINWKVIVNRIEHEWRNPAKVINVGIRAAAFKYILVMGPDSEFYTDVISILRGKAVFYDKAFFLGQVAFTEPEMAVNRDNEHLLKFAPFGSVFVGKEALEQIRGYSEQFTQWGGEDDEVRNRLEFAGWTKMIIPEARLIHREPVTAEHRERVTRSRASVIPALRKKIFLPEQSILNDPYWGTDFNEVVYSYEHNMCAYDQLLRFLEQFDDYEIASREVFERKRNVIALAPLYNEKNNIQGLLDTLENSCDGIILLDDGSEDATYEMAQSPKILLKVKQQRTNKMEDLKNRNLLLRMGCFFYTEWLFFIDADERFDPRFADVRAMAAASPSSSICFYLVHLWNQEDLFRTDVPEQSLIGQPGILCRWRMFRKTGHLQISSSRQLHFATIPYKKDMFLAPLLLLHYGMMDAWIRQFKKDRYEREDPDVQHQQSKYDYFNDDKVTLASKVAIDTLPAIIYSKKNYRYVSPKGRFSPLFNREKGAHHVQEMQHPTVS